MGDQKQAIEYKFQRFGNLDSWTINDSFRDAVKEGFKILYAKENYIIWVKTGQKADK